MGERGMLYSKKKHAETVFLAKKKKKRPSMHDVAKLNQNGMKGDLAWCDLISK